MEGHRLFVVLHEGYEGTEQEILSLLQEVTDDMIAVLRNKSMDSNNNQY